MLFTKGSKVPDKPEWLTERPYLTQDYVVNVQESRITAAVGKNCCSCIIFQLLQFVISNMYFVSVVLCFCKLATSRKYNESILVVANILNTPIDLESYSLNKFQLEHCLYLCKKQPS